MNEPKFPTQEAYFAWCAGVCQKIKVNCIAMNDDGIRKAVHEIDDMLYTTDHQELAGPSTIAALTAERDELRRGLRLALVYMDDDIQQMFDMERHGIPTNVESVNNQAYEFDRLAKLIGFKSKYHPRMKDIQPDKEQDDE